MRLATKNVEEFKQFIDSVNSFNREATLEPESKTLNIQCKTPDSFMHVDAKLSMQNFSLCEHKVGAKHTLSLDVLSKCLKKFRSDEELQLITDGGVIKVVGKLPSGKTSKSYDLPLINMDMGQTITFDEEPATTIQGEPKELLTVLEESNLGDSGLCSTTVTHIDVGEEINFYGAGTGDKRVTKALGANLLFSKPDKPFFTRFSTEFLKEIFTAGKSFASFELRLYSETMPLRITYKKAGLEVTYTLASRVEDK